MGLGDNLMATGLAKGAAKRSKRIAFGNGESIIWDHNSEQIFRGNPNIAPRGSEGAADLEWIQFYKGNRIYNEYDPINKKWIWNYNFKPVPGEIFFTDEELKFASKVGKDFILIEPYVPAYKGCAPNKTWPIDRYIHLTGLLKSRGHDVRQFNNSGAPLPGVGTVKAPSFRHALAVMAKASLYVGPEGGLHHGAATVGKPAVVIFGGFIPPQVTGYDSHINLTGGVEACGSLTSCKHCQDAMEKIKIKHVYHAIKEILECSTSSAGSGEPSGRQSVPNDFSQASVAI